MYLAFMFVSQTGYGGQILVCLLFGVLFKVLILANSPTSMHIIYAGGVLVSFFSSVLLFIYFSWCWVQHQHIQEIWWLQSVSSLTIIISTSFWLCN